MSKFDLVVLGAGPGGYVAAIRAAQRGAKVALVEKGYMGGTCLNVGCIPSKALIAGAEVLRKVERADQYGIKTGKVEFDYHHMRVRKDQVVEEIRGSLEGLLAANKITILRGHGKFVSPNEIKVLGEDNTVVTFDKAIIATGSEPRDMAAFPFDGERVHSSSTLWDAEPLPKRLAVIGGGIIGCEMASLYEALGAQVTILELLPDLISTEGKELGATLRAAYEKQGIKVLTEVMVEGIDRPKGKPLKIKLKGKDPIEADMALVAVGRKLNTDGIGLEAAGVVVEKGGSIPVNDRMETNIPHIYAIGDITAKIMLAHVASHQGLVAAANATGGDAVMHYNAVPSIIFTHPEIASVGLTLEKAKAAGYDAVVGKFPFQYLGKSVASIETEGFARVVIDRKTEELLGAQVVGYEAPTLIAQIAQAITSELTAESVEETIHAHPTISEAWLEATLLAAGRPIHLPPPRPHG
ncbi:MAG: dihydrolipoyl dehydrogenase [Parachlamydiales bacterium]